VESDGKSVCLICQESISAVKEYILKRHYGTKHATKFARLQDQVQTDKLNLLKKSLKTQQSVFKEVSEDAESYVKASYITAQKISKRSKPFSDGEFVKECLVAAAEVVCPNKTDAFKKISLSRMTVTRRLEELASNVEETLKTKLLACKFYSLALDESTDLTDTAQLAIFIRGIDDELKVFEERLVLCPLKGTTKGTDILEATKTTVARYHLSLKNLVGLATDGAPAMVGTKVAFVALKKKGQEIYTSRFTSSHCIIH
jgi:hypothetical protein